MNKYDNQDVLGDYRLYIKEVEVKNQYKFEVFKKALKHSYINEEKILSLKREKDEKVISNIIVWSEYIYFVKRDSFNRVSVVKVKINGKKITPLMDEMEFESLMKQRGYSNSGSIGYIKLFLKNEKLYMASIVNQKCFSLDSFNKKGYIENVISCEFNGELGKKYELIGLNEEGNVALLINNTDKNSIIKIDSKESKTINMSILE